MQKNCPYRKLLQNIRKSPSTSGVSIMSYFAVALPGSPAKRRQKLEMQALNPRLVKAIINMRV